MVDTSLSGDFDISITTQSNSTSEILSDYLIESNNFENNITDEITAIINNKTSFIDSTNCPVCNTITDTTELTSSVVSLSNLSVSSSLAVTEPNSEDSEKNSKSDSMSEGVIAAIVICSILAVIGLVVLFAVLNKKRSENKNGTSNENKDDKNVNNVNDNNHDAAQREREGAEPNRTGGVDIVNNREKRETIHSASPSGSPVGTPSYRAGAAPIADWGVDINDNDGDDDGEDDGDHDHEIGGMNVTVDGNDTQMGNGEEDVPKMAAMQSSSRI